jgi:nucleoside-diphosphate-sugar epimerase
MRVLLLGGTGAMGMPLAQELIANGNEVFITSRKRHLDNGTVKYIIGNAMDDLFLNDLLNQKYDVIVDFMIYTENQLKSRINRFLQSCSQYIFLSSCRVYAPSDKPLTEESPRLLDVCKDEAYLKTNEYALAKAKEENLIFAQKQKNWTIIRPSVTYNNYRLQLGCYEFSNWLLRAKDGKPIVFQRDLSSKITSMTYGDDVAKAIALVVGNKAALGEVIQIASPETKSWNEILSIYMKALESQNILAKVVWQNSSVTVAKLLGREWQRIYAKLVDRKFDSSKLEKICGQKISYTPIEKGLTECVINSLSNASKCNKNFVVESYLDRICNEKTNGIKGVKNCLKYLICRYTPYLRLKIKNYSED